MAEIAKDKFKIDRSIACKDCRRLAEGEGYFTVKRQFRTPLPSAGTVQVTWAVGQVCRVSLKAGEENAGEWAYPLHALLEHPETRGATVYLCVVAHKVSRSPS